MKGLLLKDLYMAARCGRTYLLIGLFFLGMGLLGQSSPFILAYPFMMWSMIPVTLLSYDEHDRWNAYSCALPYTRAQLVTVKYIMGALGALIIWGLTMLVQALRLSNLGALEPIPFLEQMALLLCAGFLPPALCLPFIFRLGSEKGRLAYMVTIGVFCGITAGIGAVPMETGISVPSLLPLAVSVAAYVISWRVSIRIYEKREL